MKNRKINYLKLGVLLFGISLCLWNCEKDEINTSKDGFIQTVSLKDALHKISNFSKNSQYAKNSKDIELSFNSDLASYDNLNNSREKILVIPAKTRFKEVSSKILALKINDTIQTVLFNIRADSTATTPFFTGFASITNLAGEFIFGFRIENGNLIRGFSLKKKTQQRFLQKVSYPCEEDLVKDDTFCDNLIPEVIITASSNYDEEDVIPVYYFYYDSGGGGSGSDDGVSWDTSNLHQGGSSSNTDGDQNGQQTNNPCSKIKAQLQDVAVATKLNTLKDNTSLKQETGYIQNKDGSFTLLSETTNNGNSLKIPVDRNNTIGYIHTHLDDYLTGEIDKKTGLPKMNKPIKMFSPKDIINFLQIAKYTKYNGIPLSSVYGTMVSSAGIYTLRFTGNQDDISSLALNDEVYEQYFKLYKNDPEKAFLMYLKDKVNINGLHLFKVTNNNTTAQEKTLSSTNTVNSTDCDK